MHLFNRRPHEGSSSVIQIGEGMNVIEVEILEVVGEQVIVGVFAPGEVPVRRKEAVPAGTEEPPPKPPTVQ